MKFFYFQLVIKGFIMIKMLCSHRFSMKIRCVSINKSNTKIFVFEILISYDCVFKVFTAFFKVFIRMIARRTRRQ